MRFHSGKQAFRGVRIPRRPRRSLSRRQAERDSKVFWDSEQSDRHPVSRWDTGIASQPLVPREPIVGPRCPGKGQRLDVWAGSIDRLDLYFYPLLAQQLSARSSMHPTAPISPEQWPLTSHQRMEHQTHPAGFLGGATVPLTGLAQRTLATLADPGRIDDTQAPIPFCAPLLRKERLPGRTAQRPIGLEGEILTSKAALFPGQGYFCRSISRPRRR